MIARIAFAATLVMLVSFAPANAAPEQLDPQQAVKRLDGCLATGAPGAPRSSLQAAVVALRGLCRPQIDRVLEQRYTDIDADYGLPGTKLTPGQQAERDARRVAARKLLDREIAVAVSRYTQILPNPIGSIK